MPLVPKHSFLDFVLRLLAVDLVLLVAHVLCARVLVDGVVTPLDYLLRTMGLAWILHKFVESHVRSRDAELMHHFLDHYRALRAQLADLGDLLRAEGLHTTI